MKNSVEKKKNMNMENVVKEILKFSKEREWSQFHKPANLSKSIVIEAAELLECFQWNDDQFNLDNVTDELADIFNYCILLAETLDIDIEQAILSKLEKNKEKYPIELSKGKSLKYSQLK